MAPETLELSMGMSGDFEQAVREAYWTTACFGLRWGLYVYGIARACFDDHGLPQPRFAFDQISP